MVCLERLLHSHEEDQAQDRHRDHQTPRCLDRNVTSSGKRSLTRGGAFPAQAAFQSRLHRLLQLDA
jgi:hypothetical protein